MSLLLDALKEAENRSRPAPSEPPRPKTPPQPTPPPAHRDGNHPSVEQPLSLVEEMGATPPPAAPVSARRGHTSSGRELPPPVMAKVKTPAPVRGRSWPRYLILVALPLAGALYWAVFRGASSPPPTLAPPLVNSRSVSSIELPEPAALGKILDAETATDAREVAATASTAVSVATQALPAEPVVVPAELERRGSGDVAPVPRDNPPASDAAAQPGHVIVQRSSPLVDAHVALRAGNLPRAETLYRETLASDPDQPDARLGMALIEQSRGSNAAAVAHYRAVFKHRPEDPQAWSGIADLAGDGELEAVESKLRNLLARRPDPALYFALGNVLVRLSRWAEAQESYFAAASGAPRNADYAFNLAVALDRLGKGRAAIPYYTQALTLAADERAVQFDAVAVRARLDLLERATP